MKNLFTITAFAAVLILFGACKKGDDFVPDNNAPYYDGIPTVKVENYVNRLYIDLIGREPLDSEMVSEVAVLRAAHLSVDARLALITKLQTDTNFIAGDSSYFVAYNQRLYDLFKFRLMEGASNDVLDQYIGMAQQYVLGDSLSGDSLNLQLDKQRIIRLQKVKTVPFEYRAGTIDIREVHKRMLYNDVYDFINMNSFNFVRASFNDLFSRYPTDNEFDDAFAMVENNEPRILFGQPGQDKGNLVDILVNSYEFKEGLIRWAFRTYMAREATTNEVYALLNAFNSTLNFQQVQKDIMKTDEYANFN